ncbi:MAG: hypothetical protein BWX80_02234 [Candidatus Hydrogenedentes bacterium ADurb.Bin101]|jgi:hypothetical protein|nr:hypothetical protein [Candidatus Hydrogenedentota bacterium]OQC05043.1 MAG: hypothetical protein BWX80_02234 [Candidatus Hydrogenedentes bacterium ADurb.Bin101]HOC70583.1 hypothetical protein [Candidatus Hydrogenedentota bacterium]
MQRDEAENNIKQAQYRQELEALKRLVQEQLEKESGPIRPAIENGQQPKPVPGGASPVNGGEKSVPSVPKTDNEPVPAPVTRPANHGESARIQKLREIEKKLEQLEQGLSKPEEPEEEMFALQDTQAPPAEGEKEKPAVPSQPAQVNQLFSLNTTLSGSSQTSTQEEALKIARQQSQRQTKKEAAKILEGADPPRASSAVSNGSPPLPSRVVTADEDEIGGPVEEVYPRPKDTLFVFPDQSVSIVIKRRRSNFKLLLTAGVLLLIAGAGIAAYIAQGILSESAIIQAPETGGKTEVKMLTLTFPSDQSFGTLYDTSKEPASDTEWPPYADARGVVEYPDTMKLHLVVRAEHVGDLSPLTKLPPRSIASLWLPAFDMSEPNLSALHSLERVSLIYIDQVLTERERDRIAAGFKGSVTVTSKIPGAVVRDMTPPDARMLTFPEGEAVGRLAIRRWNDPAAPWQYLDVARGQVEIPAKMEVQLQTGPAVYDLSFFKSFDRYAIHTLVLKGRHVTDYTVQGAAALQGLIALELIDTQVTGAGMEAISTIQGLQQIKIQNTELADDGLLALRDLSQLSTVEIIGAPKITAKSFDLFKKLKALRRLHVQETAITPEDLRELGRVLSSCAISSF